MQTTTEESFAVEIESIKLKGDMVTLTCICVMAPNPE